MEIPNKLIIRKGKLETKDGTPLNKYLTDWQAKHGFSDVDVIILPRQRYIEMEEDRNQMVVTWEWKQTLRQRFHNLFHFLTK